ncbi:hypothetical protein MalM14_24390 [Gimesia chilikensis]|nr:hypothetical protein MalM14_24390 [Gimesia chilikensis]
MPSVSYSMPNELRKCQFSIFRIIKSAEEPNRFIVWIEAPEKNKTIDSVMTGEQLICFSKFQKVFLIDHGILPYNKEIDQARGSHQRCQIWRSILTSYSSELE